MRLCVMTKTAKEGLILAPKTRYDGDGLTGRWIEIWQTALPNASFFFTNQDRVVCEERLTNNASDLALEPYPLEQSFDNPHFFVPVPLRAAHILMLTGYNVEDIKRAEVASAINSIYLFEPPVYILMLIFVLLMMLLVLAASQLRLLDELIRLDILDSMESLIHRPIVRMRRKLISRPGFARTYAFKQMMLFSRDTSSAPKMISILVTLLTFGLITYFGGFFSTKSIVEEKPSILDTYVKIADHSNASVFFTGTQPQPSDLFRTAPADSVKGRIWARYRRTPAYGTESNSNNLMNLPEIYMLMRHHKYVMISTYARMVACMICALRLPGELRHMHIMADPSEPQHIYGLALSTKFKGDRYVHRKLTSFTESALIEHLRDFALEFVYDFVPDRENLMQQRVACLDGVDDEAEEPSAVPLDFWCSFVHVALSFLLFASIILIIEHLSVDLTKCDAMGERGQKID